MSAPAVPSRVVTRPVSFVAAARDVFGLTFEGMLWSRRSALTAVLLALPVALSLLGRLPVHGRAGRLTGFDLYATLVAVFYVRNLVPLAALFYGSALIADEIEGKTLTYLLTRPIQRSAILAGKFLAYLATTLALTLPGIVVSFFILAPGDPAGLAVRVAELFRDLGTTTLGLLAYGALFTVLGVLARGPVIGGLLFLFGWELLAYLPGYAPRLTITAYLRSLLSYPVARQGVFGLSTPTLPAWECVASLVAVSILLFAAAVALFSRREYVMEQ